ncbi:hypothetical protein [Plantactinospora sp. GCM10030261]|uniref:hypothetical protein n=1 Tax=Plantactinospora sp. GCM10030261 TaxID=3273420 RepID=UPI0036185B41
MRRTIALLINGVLRSRLGVAVALAVVVLGVVGAARLISGPNDERTGVNGQPAGPITTVHPTTGDDGLTSDGGPVSPKAIPGVEPPESVARSFATAWLRRDLPADRWHTGLAPYATSTLAGRLGETDPAGVPAERLTGYPVLTPQTADLVQVSMPVDTGILHLQLVDADGAWRVDAVDWERAS